MNRRRRIAIILTLLVMVSVRTTNAETIQFTYSGVDVTGIGGTSQGYGEFQFAGIPISTKTLADVRTFSFSQTTNIPNLTSSFSYGPQDVQSLNFAFTLGGDISSFSLVTAAVKGTNDIFFPESFAVNGRTATTFNDFPVPLQQGTITFLPIVPTPLTDAQKGITANAVLTVAALSVLGILEIPLTSGLSTLEVAEQAVILAGGFAPNGFVDPPGVDYKHVATPSFLSAPPITSDDVLTTDLANQANKILDDRIMQHGHLLAASDTYQRLVAAQAAGDPLAVQLQVGAYDQFLTKVATISTQVAQDEATFLLSLQQAGVPDMGLSPSALQSFQAQLDPCSLASFPELEQSIFSQAGLPDSSIQNICKALLGIDPANVPTGLFATLNQQVSDDLAFSQLFMGTDQRLLTAFAVPEVSTVWLLSIGLALAARRRKKRVRIGQAGEQPHGQRRPSV